MIIHCIKFKFKLKKKILTFLKSLLSADQQEAIPVKTRENIWNIWNNRIQALNQKPCELYINSSPVVLNSEIICNILKTIGLSYFHTVNDTVYKLSIESILPSPVVLRFSNLFVPCSRVCIDFLDQPFQYIVRFVSDQGTFVLTIDPLSNSYILHDCTTFSSFTPQKDHNIVDMTSCFDLRNDMIISDIGIQIVKTHGTKNNSKTSSNIMVLKAPNFQDPSLQYYMMYGVFSPINPIETILSFYKKPFARYNNNEPPYNINEFSSLLNCAFNTLICNLLFLDDKTLYAMMPENTEEISNAIIESDYAFGLKNKMSTERINNIHNLLYSIIKMHALMKIGVFQNECYTFDSKPIFVNIDVNEKKTIHNFHIVSSLLSDILSTIRSNFVVKKSEHFLSFSNTLPEPVFCQIQDKYMQVNSIIIHILHSGSYILTLCNNTKQLPIWFHVCEDIYVMDKNFDGWEEYDNTSQIWKIELPTSYNIPKNEWSEFLLSILPVSSNVISNLPVVSNTLYLSKLYLDKGFLSDYNWTNNLITYQTENDLSAFKEIKNIYKNLNLNLSFDELCSVAQTVILFDLPNNNYTSNTNDIIHAKNILKSITLPADQLRVFFLRVLMIQRMLQDYRVV